MASHRNNCSIVGAFVLLAQVFAPVLDRQILTTDSRPAGSPKTAAWHSLIYASPNLEGHEIFAECNPGGGSVSQCSQNDVRLQVFDRYGEITSNYRRSNTYVNAIGYKKFAEVFPQRDRLALGAYQYQGQVSLSTCPSKRLDQVQNPQAIHFMAMLWDGRNALYPANRRTLEGVLYWQLNPWQPDYGRVKVYSAEPPQLVDTGITLRPEASDPGCTSWHTFELEVDFRSQEYIAVTIDGARQELNDVELARVSHPEWGRDVSMSITTESMAAWPQYECPLIFTWTTRFRNLKLSHLVRP